MTTEPDPAERARNALKDEWFDEVFAAIGGEDTQFVVTAKPDDGRGFPFLVLNCEACRWGESVGQMELWELAVDARSHWETEHSLSPATAHLNS